MVHGTRERLGALSVFAMMVPYCMIHFGKPMPETVGAVIANFGLYDVGRMAFVTAVGGAWGAEGRRGGGGRGGAASSWATVQARPGPRRGRGGSTSAR